MIPDLADLEPRELRERGMAFSDALSAVRGKASLAELEDAAVGPARLRDVATVRPTEDMPTGMADLAGVKAVGGIVIAKRDADLGKLVEEVKKTLVRECRKLPRRAADPARLDSGAAAEVHVATGYDRTDLAARVRPHAPGRSAKRWRWWRSSSSPS